MCKYCKQDKVIVSNGYVWSENLFSDMVCYTWRKEYGAYVDPKRYDKVLSKPKKWKFCPMCGEELK